MISSVINDLRNLLLTQITNNTLNPEEIRDCINKMQVGTCQEVRITLNTDKMCFGVKVYPRIEPADVVEFLTTEEPMVFNNYKLEIDSRLTCPTSKFDAYELAAMIIHEINSAIDNPNHVNKIRGCIDTYLVDHEDVINIRESVNYAQLFIFALKDTSVKMSSILYNEPEAIIANPAVRNNGLDEVLLSAQEKLKDLLITVGDDVPSPKVVLLRWLLELYKDMKYNSAIMVSELRDAYDATGSTLEQDEIQKCIAAINKIDTTIKDPTLHESVSLNKFFDEKAISSLNELSIFKSMRKNGLKSIEDSLYEYKLLIKNCDTEEDAVFIMRGINNRIGILQDYIYNEPDISESEKKHWQNIIQQYHELRINLTKKKIYNKSSYGLFFDYNKLDQLDEAQAGSCPKCGSLNLRKDGIRVECCECGAIVSSR